jgi:class 3 adenylate cyclase
MTAAPDGIRRLKAIMFTDIKGYSAMMGLDEDRTVKLVLEHREIVRDCIAHHGGTEHETIGDAFVVLFDSVVNAVRCGGDIQERLRQRNASVPKEEQVWLRIGIHLGDIIVQGDGIYGDGVNVAARVQDKADPGGISITEQVYLQIDGKMDLSLEPMGKTELKNIRNPPNLYKVRMRGDGHVRRSPVLLPVVMAVVLLLLGGAAAAWLLQHPTQVQVVAVEKPTPVVLAAPTPPTPQAPVEDKKALAGRKVAAAMEKTGATRVELLRQALSLDPDNPAVQSMLAAAMAPPVPTLAAAPTAAVVPAPLAGYGSTLPGAASSGRDHPAAGARGTHGKSRGEDGGDTHIKRSIVVE